MVKLASQMAPQCAPASDSPNRVAGGRDHLPDGVKVPRREVHDGNVEELGALPSQHGLVDKLGRIGALGSGQLRNRQLGPQVVVDGVGEHVHGVEATDPVHGRGLASVSQKVRLLGEDSQAPLGGPQRRHPLGQGQPRDLGVGSAAAERVLRRLEPEQDANRPGRHLPFDFEAFGPQASDVVQQLAGACRDVVSLQDSEAKRPPAGVSDAGDQVELRPGELVVVGPVAVGYQLHDAPGRARS